MDETETRFTREDIDRLVNSDPKPLIEAVFVPPDPSNYLEPWQSFQVSVDSTRDEVITALFSAYSNVQWADKDSDPEGIHAYYLPDIPPYRIVASEGIPPFVARLAANNIFNLCEIVESIKDFGVPYLLFEINRKFFYEDAEFEEVYEGAYPTKNDWVDSLMHLDTSVNDGMDLRKYYSFDYEQFLNDIESKQWYLFVKHEDEFHVFRWG
jgi:hypothetical protein